MYLTGTFIIGDILIYLIICCIILPQVCQQLKTVETWFLADLKTIWLHFFNLKYCTNGIKTLLKNDGDMFFDQITS